MLVTSMAPQQGRFAEITTRKKSIPPPQNQIQGIEIVVPVTSTTAHQGEPS